MQYKKKKNNYFQANSIKIPIRHVSHSFKRQNTAGPMATLNTVFFSHLGLLCYVFLLFHKQMNCSYQMTYKG